MRRLLIGSLVLSLGWMTSAALAEEIVASSATTPADRVPIAWSASVTHAPVQLGRPRICEEGSGPALLPTTCRETADAATAGAAVPVAESGENESSSFAIERVGYVELAGRAAVAPASPLPGIPAPIPGTTLGVLPTPVPPKAPLSKLPAAVGPVPQPQLVDACSPVGPCCDDDQMEGANRPPRLYGSAEYLFWWTKNAGTPPLATTSSDPNDNGILGQPTTRLLFAGPLERDVQQGARFRLGYWFDTCKPIALEGSFFFLSPRTDRFQVSSGPNGTPVIARPFFDVNNQVESAELVASPFTSAGTLRIQAPSRFLGADLNLRCPLCCADVCTGGYRVDLLGGFRYLRLNEGLYTTEIGQNFPFEPRRPNQAFRIDDRFDTTNAFYGGQLGLTGELRRGRWSLETRGLVALGVTHQTLTINGTASFVPPAAGMAAQQPGGLLALPGANIGRFTTDHFGVVPELGLTLGYQLTDAIRLTAGYNLIYWSSVLRPGDQIDRRLDITKIPDFLDRDAAGNFIDSNGQIVKPVPGAPRPLLRETDFWAQGFTLGLEFRY
ncbi:MAG TPA: BBP7 family outer membrane beta-barrel protein [Gemmataceae bacterium]|nr:BBP7 family outer membrane beta-barrel protein [Gemmataceae bacterium]